MPITGAWVTPDPIDGDWTDFSVWLYHLKGGGYTGGVSDTRSVQVNDANSYSLYDYDHPFGAEGGMNTNLGAGLNGVAHTDPPETAAWNQGQIFGYNAVFWDDTVTSPRTQPYPGGQKFDGDGNPVGFFDQVTWSRDPASLTPHPGTGVEWDSIRPDHMYDTDYDNVTVHSYRFRLAGGYTDRVFRTSTLYVVQEPFGKGTNILVEDDPNDSWYDGDGATTWNWYIVPLDIGLDADESPFPGDPFADPPNTTYWSRGDYEDDGLTSLAMPDPVPPVDGEPPPAGFVRQGGWFQRLLEAVPLGDLQASVNTRSFVGNVTWTVDMPDADEDGLHRVRLVCCQSSLLAGITWHAPFPDWSLAAACTDTPDTVFTTGRMDDMPRLILSPNYTPARWRRLYNSPDLAADPNPVNVAKPTTLTITPLWQRFEEIDGVTWTIDWGDGSDPTMTTDLTVPHVYHRVDFYNIVVIGNRGDENTGYNDTWVQVVDIPDLDAAGGPSAPGFYGKKA